MKVIKFEKDGCAPCQMVGSFLKDNEIEHEAINAFSNPDKAQEFDVTFSVPVTIVLDDDNNEVFRTIGFKPDDLEKVKELTK